MDETTHTMSCLPDLSDPKILRVDGPGRARSLGRPTIEVKGATHFYGEKQVLKGIDLALRAGETYGLLGPNGAGKTTLMKAICGRIALTSGHVAILGRDPSSDHRARRAISFIPQEIAIYPHLTVQENLEVFGRFAGARSGELRRAVKEVLARAGLEDRARQRCHTLSGGYQRRVNLCASILQSPKALVLDEPTVGIDIDAREAIHALLLGLRERGAALLIATHDLEQAQMLCDRVGLMQDGRIGLEGEPTVLLRRAFGTDKEIIASLRGTPDEHGATALHDMGFLATQSPAIWSQHLAEGQIDAARLARELGEAGVAVKEIRIREPDLSSLFMSMLSRYEEP